MSRINLDVGPITRIRAIERAVDRLLASTIVGSGGVVVSGSPGAGYSVSVPFANAFEFVAYDTTKAVNSATVKNETDLKLNRSAKATGGEAIAGTDVEKWVNPYSLKQAINAKIIEMAASENPDLDAINSTLGDKLWADFSNADYDESGATGAARATLSNVNPATGRTSLALSGYRSLAELPYGLSPSDYTDALEALMQSCIDDGLSFYVNVGEVNPINTRGVTDRTINLIGFLNIFGEGNESYLVTTGFNAPIIRMHITEDINTSSKFIRDVHFYNNLPSTDNMQSCGVEFTGSAFLTYMKCPNVATTGCYASFVNNMDTFSSSFGQESYMNHCEFRSLASFYHPSTINAKYGVWHKKGSGTGNTYPDLKGNLARRGFPVTSVSISNQGAGYITAPTVSVTDNTSGLTLQAVLGTGGSAGKVVELNILTPGFLRPTDTIVFTGGSPTTPATATFTYSTADDICLKPAHVRIDGGPGVVAGDVLADGSISGLEACHVSVDGRMNYRNAIRVVGPAQIDAQATSAIRYDPIPTDETYGHTLQGVVGGEIDITAGFLRFQGSIIDHQGVGEHRGGVARGNLPAGAVVEILRLENIRQYGGASVEIVCAGIVQGVGGGVCRKVFAVSKQASAAAPVGDVESSFVSPSGFNGFIITATAVGGALVFRATLTSPTGGSDLDAQFRVTGGHLNSKRGLT